MIVLKNKIKKINSLPNEKKNISITKIITIICITLISILSIYISYIKLLPYINAIDINKIIGKKINYTECNTKDFIIISKDKSFTMGLTDKDCKTHHYEGTLHIKNNEIYFKDNIKGIIDKNYNIIINNNLFESDINE